VRLGRRGKSIAGAAYFPHRTHGFQGRPAGRPRGAGQGYALDPATEPSLFQAESVASLVEDIRGDIRDYSKLAASLTEFAPEVVFHLAAQPLIRRSYADPLGSYATNVMGTAHVLEAVRKAPSVGAVVCVTTDKCYEIVSAAYRSSFFPVDRLHEHHVAVATARAGNVIGGGDWSEDRLIPDLMRGSATRNRESVRPAFCAWM